MIGFGNGSLSLITFLWIEGYVKHESGGWSDKLNRWVFLPRRACKEAFTSDEEMGTNVILVCSENFEDIEVTFIVTCDLVHGGYLEVIMIPGSTCG